MTQGQPSEAPPPPRICEGGQPSPSGRASPSRLSGRRASPSCPSGTAGKRARSRSEHHRGTLQWRRLPGSALQRPPEVFFLRTRLHRNLDWWRSAGASKEILATIKHGARLEFKHKPRPFRSRPIPLEPSQREWVSQELDRGIASGAFETATCFDFVAPAFIVTSGANRKKRLVIDFSNINRQCIKMACRYEGLKDLKHMLRKGDYMFSLDLTDAFWHIPIQQHHRKYLTFTIGGRTLQCAALPFGWTGSPLTFTKVLRAFVRYLRSRGIRCLPYCDDFAFFVHGTYEQALRARTIVEEALTLSGLQRKPSKGQWDPSHRLHDHLGMTIDSSTGLITAPPRRCAATSALAREVLHTSAQHSRFVPSHLLRRFAGTGSSLSLALRSARFRLRSIWDCLEEHLPRSRLSRQAITDLQWWASLHASHPENGMPIWPPTTSRTLWVDASSETGWGAQLRWAGRTVYSNGYWKPGTEAESHITWKELRTVRLAMTALLPEMRNQHILVWEDNMPVMRILCSGTSRSPFLMHELRKLWHLMHANNITLLPRYIASADNPADYWSRWRDRSAWSLAPNHFRHALYRACEQVRLPPLTLDAFACRVTALLPRYASRFADPDALARDAFSLDWSSECVWVNPPWELLPQALTKIRSERTCGVVIAPYWPAQQWWPLLLDITVFKYALPHPRYCVRAAHNGVVEPRLHPSTALYVFIVDARLCN